MKDLQSIIWKNVDNIINNKNKNEVK